MRAWICDRPVGVDALKWLEQPTPDPATGQVRVAIRAASLNFPDLLIVQNKYQFKPPLPFVPGSEYAGYIDALGAGVDGLAIGDPVAVLAGTGGFATHAVVPAAQVLALPPDFAIDDGAAFIMTYGTSYLALVDRAQLRAGETVLVLGAAGGVGTAAIQIAKAVGARVIAAASSDDKCALCRSIGADEAINYANADLREAIRSATAGQGVDVVYDPVGGPVAEPVFRSIAWRGRYLVIGFTDGQIPALPLNLPLLKGASIVGVFWGEFMRREPEAAKAALGELLAWYGRGLIKPVIDMKLPMTDLAQAYARMASRQVRGKLLLLND